MATGMRLIGDQGSCDSCSTLNILHDWNKFAQMLLDRSVSGTLRRERLEQERHDWFTQLAGSDDCQSAPDSHDAELWADLPTSSDYDESDTYSESRE